jgi:hypothetical protein
MTGRGGSRIPVYVEAGSKRVFAGAVDWPGWARSGRDRDAALEALVEYGPRYKSSMKRAVAGLSPPADRSGLEVAERVKGGSGTDFGVLGASLRSDREDLAKSESGRFLSLLRAAWRAFDRSAEDAKSKQLRKGPRGGGRSREAIVRHVMEAEAAYLAKLGASYRKITESTDIDAELADIRSEAVQVFRSRARGEPAPRTPRSGSLWTPSYFVRRSAWHALDHAWEIEDRSEAEA